MGITRKMIRWCRVSGILIYMIAERCDTGYVLNNVTFFKSVLAHLCDNVTCFFSVLNLLSVTILFFSFNMTLFILLIVI